MSRMNAMLIEELVGSVDTKPYEERVSEMLTDLLTYEAFAAKADISLHTLSKYITLGKVPTVKIGRREQRIPKSALSLFRRRQLATA